jgi:DtxR family Mn-dependent transcriptional regulator
MSIELSQSVEDYLKAIYELTNRDGRASTTQLADYLEITPASVTGMIKKLSATEPPYLEYQKHRGVSLTDEGKQIAIRIVRRHRLLEMFLQNILSYPWDEVDAEADQLEHVISNTFEDRIAEVLGNPEYDPHGDPIPNKDLTIPDISTMKLSSIRPGQTVLIKRVRDTDSDLLKYLQKIGITPGARVTVTEHSSFDGNLHLQLHNYENTEVLGPRITDQIYVELID